MENRGAKACFKQICGERVLPKTQKAKKYVRYIQILSIFQFIISVMDIVASNSFVREGVFGLCFLILLINAFHKLSYNSIVLYTFMSMFFCIIFLVYILTILQNGASYTDVNTDWKRYYISVAAISCVFYGFNSIFYFFPYKQFKANQLESNVVFYDPNMQGNFEDADKYKYPTKETGNAMTHQYMNNKDEVKQKQNFDKFGGINTINTTSKAKKTGSFQAFTGTGVKIG